MLELGSYGDVGVWHQTLHLNAKSVGSFLRT